MSRAELCQYDLAVICALPLWERKRPKKHSMPSLAGQPWRSFWLLAQANTQKTQSAMLEIAVGLWGKPQAPSWQRAPGTLQLRCDLQKI